MKPEAPCNHWDDQIGTISAGDITPGAKGPFCGVATCADCITKSAGYVQMMTGLPADPFLSYEEARASRGTLDEAPDRADRRLDEASQGSVVVPQGEK